MAQIKTLEQFRDYIKTKLGYPVINVEVDDTQFDQIIEDSVQDFCRYNYSDGTFLEYMVFSAQSGISHYPMSGQDIEGIFDMNLSIGIDGINTLFSPTHEILYSDFVKQGSMFSESGGFGASPGLILATYDSAMLYLQEIKNTFGKMYTVRWLAGRETMVITPTPTADVIGMIYLYRREIAQNLYNHNILKKLCVARSKMQWGGNLKKYDAEMPEGIRIRGAELFDEGKDEEEKIMEDLKLEGEPIDFFMG
jgi:hypothetical protein